MYKYMYTVLRPGHWYPLEWRAWGHTDTTHTVTQAPAKGTHGPPRVPAQVVGQPAPDTLTTFLSLHTVIQAVMVG